MATNNNRDDANPRGMQRPPGQRDLNQRPDQNIKSDKKSQSPAEKPADKTRKQPPEQPDLNRRRDQNISSDKKRQERADKVAGKDDADPRGMPRPRERKVISTTPPSGSGTRNVPRGINVGRRDEEGKPLTNKRNIMDKVRDRKIEKMKSRTAQGKPSRYGK